MCEESPLFGLDCQNNETITNDAFEHLMNLQSSKFIAKMITGDSFKHLSNLQHL